LHIFYSSNIVSRFDNFQLAVQANEREVSLHMLGQVYRIDIERLIQINEMTGNARQVQRRAITHQTPKCTLFLH
jgi:hypothetical protein